VKNASFLIGYVIFWKIFDECEILNLVVHPEWRRKKIASFLMKKVMSEVFFSGDAKKISLDVRADNPSGIAFYKKMGFFQEQVQKCFTTDQKDALRMIFYRNKA
jgi:ribosomal-protein-alanine N-acetyltransferase